VLELFCLIIVFRNNSIQQASYINSSRGLTGSFYAQKEKMTGFLRLREMNDSLLRENARLKNQLGLPVMLNPLLDSSFTKISNSDSVTRTVHYNYIPAKVLNNTVDQKINYITLNIGRKHGVKERMAVISSNGIVGRISHVSENYSVALSFLSDKLNVSAMVSDGTVGKLSWDGKDASYGLLSGISQSVKLKPRDSVFTSGFGDFPEKILVGRVAQVMNGTTYKLYLSTNFRRLHFVYVIAEEVDIERKQLEDSTQVNP
jgi:rod shape-determining protein MreC